MTTATAVLGVLALGVMAGFGNADIGRSRALPGLRAEQPAPILVKNKPCKDLDDDDKEDSSALMEGNLSLVLYRVKGWDEDNLSTGKWVGVVRRNDTNTGTSRIFPGIKKFACLHVTMYQGSSPAESLSTALLNRDGEAIPIRPKNSKICIHATKHVNPQPAATTTPTVCPPGSRVHFTFQTDTKQVEYLSWTATENMEQDFRKAVQLKYGEQRTIMTDPQIAKLAAAFRDGSAGAWYPCAETGCCRVWED